MGRRLAGVTWLAVVGVLTSVAAVAQETKPTGNGLKADYKEGFRLSSADGKHALRLSAGLQLRYTYVRFDHTIKGNDVDYSNFFVRRARLWLDGYTFDPRLTYYLHVQLEPASAVNLHDAWVQYAISDRLRVGIGRNKVPFGVEFLQSGFGLNFIDRSIMYGETDVSDGGGRSRWPGGNATLGLSGQSAATGFPTGGLCLYRSQGLLLSGTAAVWKSASLLYEGGVWNGRNKKGVSNDDASMLYSLRLAFFPLGAFALSLGGDQAGSSSPRIALVGSAYSETSTHDKDAAGVTVATYDAADSGTNLGVVARYHGFSADVEWGEESYTIRRHLPGSWEFDRAGWHASFGYFVVPSRVEVVARQAELERLRDATVLAVTSSGLGFVQVWGGDGYVTAVERKLAETTAGLNFYFGQHQQKLFFDVSRLTRKLVTVDGDHREDQKDTRVRSMLQVKI